MIRRTFQKLLQKSGKGYTIDPNIPERMIFMALVRRVIMLLRGFFKTGRKLFLGAGCSISNLENISFGNNVTIEKFTKIDGYAQNRLIFGDNVKIGAYSCISCTSHMSKYGVGISIGSNSAVGQFCEFGAAGGITIGNDVIMGSYISFHSENHNFSNPGILIREQGVTSKGITIGNNIWVGAKVTFLDGCSVGDNSVVAAGAVVNGSYPPNSIIGGIPAKVIKPIQ